MASTLPGSGGHRTTGRSWARSFLPRYGFLALYLVGLFGWATAVPLYGSVSRAWAGSMQVAFGKLPLWALGANMVSSILWGLLADRRPEWIQTCAKLALGLAALCTLLVRFLPPATWPIWFALMGIAMGATAAWGHWFAMRVEPGDLGRVFGLAGAGVSLLNWLFAMVARYLPPGVGMLLTLLPLALALLAPSRLPAAVDASHPTPADQIQMGVKLRTLARIGGFIIFFSLVAGLSYGYLIVTPITPYVDDVLRRLPYIICILLAGFLADRRNLLTVISFGAGVLALAFLSGAWRVPALQYISIGLNGAAFGLLESAPWLLLASLAGRRSTGRWFGWGLNLNIIPIMIGAFVALPLGRITPEHLGLIATVAIVIAMLFLQGASDPLAILHNAQAQPAPVPAVLIAAGGEITPAPAPLSAPDRLTEAYGAVLSARELEVGRLAILGMTTRDIAQQLFVSENTIKTHLRNVFRKTDAANRNELYRKLMERET